LASSVATTVLLLTCRALLSTSSGRGTRQQRNVTKLLDVALGCMSRAPTRLHGLLNKRFSRR
jgi:hypothetical protein